MSTGTEFVGYRSQGPEARADERAVRILLLEGQPVLGDPLRACLRTAERASFEVVSTEKLAVAEARVYDGSFDLLLMDSESSEVDRGLAIERASNLAHRLPVVILTGTEALAECSSASPERLSACFERADVAGKLLHAIRRARRLGTAWMTPSFCRPVGLVRSIGPKISL